MKEEQLLFARQDISEYNEQDSEAEVQTDKFLSFEIDGLKMGARVEYVVEIITNHAITRLPVVPNYVGGIINLRGQIIPIVDVRLRLGKQSWEGGCIIVLNVDGTQFGIKVDAVAQMVDVPKEQVLPMPAHHKQKLVSGMCSLPSGGTMLVLDCALLLAD